MTLRAYQVDDDTIYAAIDAEQAAVMYERDTQMACDAPLYPRLLTEAELDATMPELDENEQFTGGDTSVRAFLADATEPGMLAGTI